MAKRDASNFSGLPALMRGEGFIGKPVELTGASISLNLKVPGIRIVMSEPVAEDLQTGPVKLLDFALQQLNLGHAISLAGVIQDNKTLSFAVLAPIELTMRSAARAIKVSPPLRAAAEALS